MADTHSKVKDVADGLSVKQVLKLMEGMRKNQIAQMKLPGLELTLFPEQRPAQSAATVMAPPVKEDIQKFAAMQQGRIEAAVARRQKFEELRAKATAGSSSGTGKLVKDVFETAMATQPPQS